MKLCLFLYFSLFLILGLDGNLNAQVGVGTTTPVASSILDLTSTSKGMLVPRMTLAQKTAVASPATGLLVYQTDGSAGFWYYSGTTWLPFLNSNTGWLTLGNAGTVASTNFIGTTDAIDFVTRTNNTEKMRMTSAGNLGIGTAAPTNMLSLSGQAARTIWMERNTTAATAGNNLTLQSGGAVSGGTNLAGGDLILSSGTSTGTNTSKLTFNTSTAGASGTTDNAPSTKMTILGSGNVGIGTTTPGQLLEVSGGSILTNRAYASSTSSVVASTSAFTTGANASSQVRITDNASGTANGNLTYGGTAIEGQFLWITNADAQSVSFTSTSPTTTILTAKTVGFVYVNSAWKPVNADFISNPNDWSLLGNAGTVAATNFIGTTDAIDFVTRTNNTEKMRMTSGGNLGIGATAPGQKLETMNGNILLNNNNNTSGELRIAEPSTSGSSYSAFKTQAQSASITYTLPSAQGDFNSVLTNDGTGVLTWGNGGCQFAVKASDQSVTSSTTLVDDNAFTFTVSANHTYEITATIKASCSNSGSIKFKFVAPASSTEFITVFANRSSLDDITYLTSPTTSYDISSTSSMSNSTDMITVNGTITTAGTGGTFKLQWAQYASSGTASTLYTGSFMKLTLVQ